MGDAFYFDVIGNLPVAVLYWKIARLVCKLSADSLKNTVDVTVPAGVFKGCVKSSVAITGDGSYISSGVYPTELYLAPSKGIVKMIGKDKNGTVLYTMELVETTSPVPPTANYSGRWTGSYSSTLISSVSVIFDIVHTDSTLTGTYSAANGAAGTITGTVGASIQFTLTQTISACPGSFTGEGTVSVDTMNFIFSGTDCLGTHSNGKGKVQRQSMTSTGSLTVSSTPSGAQIVLDGTATGVVSDPSGDIEFPFADIVSGQWNFTGFLAWAGYQLIPAELRTQRISPARMPAVPTALFLRQKGAQHRRIVR